MRQWRRKRGPVAAAIVGLLESVRDGTYDADLAAHGCPTVDMTLGAVNYNRARLPFLVSPVADGGGGRTEPCDQMSSLKSTRVATAQWQKTPRLMRT